MSEEQNNGLSQLEESTYVPKQKEDRLAGVAAPVLEDTAYVAPKEKKSHLADVAAPTLADDDYVDTRKSIAWKGYRHRCWRIRMRMPHPSLHSRLHLPLYP